MNKFIRTAALALTLAAIASPVSAADAPTHPGAKVSIPTRPGAYIDWNYASFSGSGGVENSGANCGSTKANTVVTFKLSSVKTTNYGLTIATGHAKGTCVLDITLSSGNQTIFSASHNIVQTGSSWDPVTVGKWDIPNVPAGDYVLTLKPRDLYDAGAYAGNWGKLALYTDDADAVYQTSNLSYDFGSYPGCGTLPDANTYDTGSVVTIPTNHTMYVEGKTLTGWTDGSKTYTPGSTLSIQKDMTLTPVFTDNKVSLADRKDAVTLRWDFQRQNGAPTVAWQNVDGLYWVTQATINGETIDVALPFSTNPGKCANGNWNDWAQLNGGTTFKVPACEDAVVSIESYNAFATEKDGKPGTTIDGKFIADGSKNPSYTIAYDTASVDLVIGDDGTYYRYIQVVLPVAGSENNTINFDVCDAARTGRWYVENPGDHPGSCHLGYVENGNEAVFQFNNASAGIYRANVNFPWFQTVSDWTFTVTDKATGKVESSTVYRVNGTHRASFLFEGRLTQGAKELKVSVKAVGSGQYMANLDSFCIERVGNYLAKIESLTIENEGLSVVETDDYDWSYNIPVDFTDDTVDFKLGYVNGDVEVSCDGQVIEASEDGVYSIPTPAPNAEAIANIHLSTADGNVCVKNDFKARFFHLGDVKVANLKIGGLDVDEDMIASLNKDAALAVDSYVFTSIPEVVADFIDSSSAKATLKSKNGTEAVYVFSGQCGDIVKDFTLTVNGVHLFDKSENDLTTTLRYASAHMQNDKGLWTDGLYTVNPCGQGWDGTQFKMKPGVNTLSIPCDMVVKQLTLGGLKDNYAPGKVVSVTTNEDATVYLPSASSFIKGDKVEYDLVINVENHKAGAPFVINIEGGSQPVMWFDFVYEEFKLTTPVGLVSTGTSDLTGRNHAAVTFSFDREVKDATVSFDGKDIKAEGGSASLVFSLWNLEYDTDYTFVIPAGTLADNYGNTNAEALTCEFRTGVKHEDATAHDSDRFIQVSNVDELRAAVAGLSATNNKADSPRTIIYMHDGDYDLNIDDSDVEDEKKPPLLEIGKNVYNISLIGESEEGVLLHGTRTGISIPVFSTRNSTNVYMENFTVRNDLDFGAAERVGVGVAHYGGNLDIMKNVTLQSIQDTQVTGERGYYLNCTIHGNVDYICGGGDHFYDRCTLVHHFSGGFITAPSTSTANKYGYVFSNCEIKGDSNYDLGRPWQNEPRCYWLNTTMHSTSSEGGWGPMGDLTTHFYEYGSKDSDGNLLDLSKRTNSKTSLNKYTPVLTAEEAAALTVENVTGGKDSFLATELTAELEAPTATYYGDIVGWKAVKGAAGYLVYVNGKLHGFTSETTYDLSGKKSIRTRAGEADTYTVRAISANGAKGVMSAAATEDPETGMEMTEAVASEAVYYTLQGVRVANPKEGVFIRVANGKAEKVVIR